MVQYAEHNVSATLKDVLKLMDQMSRPCETPKTFGTTGLTQNRADHKKTYLQNAVIIIVNRI